MIERQTTDQIVDAQSSGLKNPQLVKNVLSLTARSFNNLPVDSAHNFDNHGLPTVLNVLTINEYRQDKRRRENSVPEDVDLDAVTCAAAIHDRQRTILGHMPGSFLARQILKNAGASPDFQHKVLALIKHHSEMDNIDNMTTEQKILNAADKFEYLNTDRAKEATPNLGKIGMYLYKKHWEKRVPQAVNFLKQVEVELGIEEMLEEYVQRLGKYIYETRPDLIKNYEGLKM